MGPCSERINLRQVALGTDHPDMSKESKHRNAGKCCGCDLCALSLLRVLFHLLNGLLDWPVYYDRLVGYYNGQADRLDWPSSIYRPGRSARKSQFFPPEFRQPVERR